MTVDFIGKLKSWGNSVKTLKQKMTAKCHNGSFQL